MDLSENIKTLRQKARFTQAVVAEKLGMTSQNYNLLENGKTELTYSKMQKLAEIFGVSVGELLGLEASVVANGGEARENEALKKEVERLKTEAGLYKELKEKNEETNSFLYDAFSDMLIEYIEEQEFYYTTVHLDIFDKKVGNCVFLEVPIEKSIYDEFLAQQQGYKKGTPLFYYPFKTKFDIKNPPTKLEAKKEYVLIPMIDERLLYYHNYTNQFVNKHINLAMKSLKNKPYFDNLKRLYDTVVMEELDFLITFKRHVNLGVPLGGKFDFDVKERQEQIIEAWNEAKETENYINSKKT